VASGLLAPVATNPAEAAFPGDNGKIAFASGRVSGGDKIFAMKPDGTGIEQLSLTTTNDHEPTWSADGGWLAYSSGGEIYMRNYDDSGAIVLIETRRLTTNTANDSAPSFSPDLSRIAFVSNRDGNDEIYVMDTADNNSNNDADVQTNLTDTAGPDFDPAWSPDGTKIAFVSSRDGDNFEIFVMDADGSDPVNLTNNAASDFVPAWSPDGSKIAFARSLDGNPDLYVMNADGSGLKRLTKGAADDFSPAWSPDGKKIAFDTNRGGGDLEIYVMKARPEGRKNRPRNLTKNDGVSDREPDWRPKP
jgi:Tol biopolymer transport system component